MLLFHSFLCYSLNPRQQGFQWEPWVKKLSIEQSNWLEKDATREEVKQAVWDYDGSKVSRPDGFTFTFSCNYLKIKFFRW